MTDIALTDDLFFERAGLDRNRVEKTVADALKGADDGELFLEYCQSESLAFDDGSWVLILPAATEPVTDLWAEAHDVDTAQALIERWAGVVEQAAT